MIAMYSIFELSFGKNARSMRLLYCIMFSDKRFPSNGIRSLLAAIKVNHRSQPRQWRRRTSWPDRRWRHHHGSDDFWWVMFHFDSCHSANFSPHYHAESKNQWARDGRGKWHRETHLHWRRLRTRRLYSLFLPKRIQALNKISLENVDSIERKICFNWTTFELICTMISPTRKVYFSFVRHMNFIVFDFFRVIVDMHMYVLFIVFSFRKVWTRWLSWSSYGFDFHDHHRHSLVGVLVASTCLRFAHVMPQVRPPFPTSKHVS